MGEVAFPTKISFIPKRQPCEEVQFNDKFVVWIAAKKTEKIEPGKEMQQFENDTLRLLEWCWSTNPDSLAEQDLSCVTDYWLRWGPLLPDGNGIIAITDLLNLGIWYFIVKELWTSTDKGEIPDSIAAWLHDTDFFIRLEDLFPEDKPRFAYKEAVPEPSSEELTVKEPRCWMLGSGYPIDKELRIALCPWEGSLKSRSKKSHCPILLVKTPSRDQVNELKRSDEARFKWIKQIVLQSVSAYIFEQNVSFQATFKGNSMNLTGESGNLFLAFLMNTLLATNQRKLEYCRCGCGDLVPPNREHFATDKCRDRMPIRKIYSWLKKRASRGQISPEHCSSMVELANDLLEDGLSEKEVRKRIMLKLNEEP